MTLDDVRREVEDQFAGYRNWRSTLRRLRTRRWCDSGHLLPNT
jgi:hypothetical protein